MKSLLAQRLRTARQAIVPEITQRDVARRLHLSPSAINLWEAGKTEPSAPDIAELARWYGVSTDWLLGVDVDPQHEPKARHAHALQTVPIVPIETLAHWAWRSSVGVLQTATAYPHGAAAAFVVGGDAMGGTAPAGAYVVVSKAHPITPSSLVLACVAHDETPILRRYQREGGADLLLADDARYPTYRLADGARLIALATEITIRKKLI